MSITETHPAPNKKLLVVDDLPEVTRELKRLFTWEGFEVETAHDGAEAIEKAQHIQPDLILLDVEMPVLDGFEVLNELLSRSVETRIVMISGKRIEINDVIKAARNGACDYLMKPKRFALILETVKRHLMFAQSTNLQIARHPSDLQRSLMAEVAQLREKASRLVGATADDSDSLLKANRQLEAKLRDTERQLQDRYASHGRLDRFASAVWKTASVGLAVLAVCCLKAFAQVSDGWILVDIFVVSLSLLLIAERLRHFSSSFGPFNTTMNVDGEGGSRP